MTSEEMGVGRCVSCGLLGKREGQSSVSKLYEATRVDRVSGILTEYRGDPIGLGSIGKRPNIHTHPWCFHNKVSLLGELQDLGADELKYDKVLEVIKKDRRCTSWYPWKEFCDPKEHWEEQMMMAMNKNREDFQKRMEEERRDFDLKLFEMNKKLSKDSHKVMVGLAIVAIVFTCVQVGLAIWR